MKSVRGTFHPENPDYHPGFAPDIQGEILPEMDASQIAAEGFAVAAAPPQGGSVAQSAPAVSRATGQPLHILNKDDEVYDDDDDVPRVNAPPPAPVQPVAVAPPREHYEAAKQSQGTHTTSLLTKVAIGIAIAGIVYGVYCMWSSRKKTTSKSGVPTKGAATAGASSKAKKVYYF